MREKFRFHAVVPKQVVITDEGCARPIFVLSLARSGSTLTRLILDTHPEIYAPPELNLGKLAVSLYRTISGLEGKAAFTVSSQHMADHPQVVGRVREVISGLIDPYMRRKGRRIWCEKTPDNLEYRDILAHLFPEAKFICLYRQVLDVTRSCLDASREGFLPVLQDYIRRDPGNSIAAVVSYWTDGTAALLDFERALPGQTFRLRYEDLVTNPREVLGPLFAFLGLEWSPDLVESVYSVAHEVGLGDTSAHYAGRIRSDSIGKGGDIPLTQIPVQLRRQMDPLLERLGYDLVQSGERSTAGSLVEPGREPRWIFETLLPDRLRSRRTALALGGISYSFVVHGAGGGSWLLKDTGEDVQVVTGEEEATCRVEIEASDLIDLVQGKMDAVTALHGGRIRISGRVGDEAFRGLLGVLRVDL